MNKTEVNAGAKPVELAPHKNGPAPRLTAGDSQLLSPRSRVRELFSSSWLRSPAKVAHEDGTSEGRLLDYCSTGLVMQADGRKKRTARRWTPLRPRTTARFP
jgi:hypothetical protein